MKWLAIGGGAALGAWLRYTLGIWLFAFHNEIPLGTLAANLGGGFMAGIAIAFFENNATLPPEWRLFVITGFLGGLTTFSTFSGEAMHLLQNGNYMWAFGHSVLHLVGSIAFCMLGYALYRLIFL